MLVEPNGRSVIPAVVRFTVDARHSDPDALALLQQRHERLFAEVAERRDLELAIRIDSDRAPVPCDRELVATAQRAAEAAGISALTMPRGRCTTRCRWPPSPPSR